MQIKQMTDIELIQEYKALDNMIYEVECYGTRDIILMTRIGDELERRGYLIEADTTLNITKEMTEA